MATDLTIKTLEADTIGLLAQALASYLSTGGWNQADIVSCDITSNVAGTKFTCLLAHATTPAV